MNRRKKTSGGQAIVMVTLSLMAMTGMMGLAVDLGWSFFVKKEAQAAADGAALAAVQEVSKRVSGVASSIVCNAATNADCQANPVPCSNYTSGSTSNLYNGCLYARINGFSAGGQAGRQNVTIQSNLGSNGLPPTVTGILPSNLAYWVTVRTVQSIPQLFSAVLGNPTGMVASRATAGVAIETLVNSFYGEDREGTCDDHANGVLCGVPLDFAVAGGRITAAGGMVLDSLCNGTSTLGCGTTSGGNGNNYAAMGSGTVTAAGPIQIRGGAGGTTGGKVDPSGTYTPPPTPGPSDGSLYQDPTKGLPQPPLAATNPAPTCGILNTDPQQQVNTYGTKITGTTGNTAPLSLGPYNYYSYHMQGSTKVPDGNAITITGNVVFSKGGGCPGTLNSVGATSQSSSSYPSYIFHGGLNVNNPNNPSNTTVSFEQGQYVMDGRLTDTSWVNNVAPVFLVDNLGASVTTTLNQASTNTAAGQMFIFTAPQSTAQASIPNYSYPGLSTQINAFPELQTATANLMQGKAEIRPDAGSVTLNGANNSSGALPTPLSPYDGILFWQDRRNSTVLYKTDGSYNCAPPFTACTKSQTQYQADRMIDNVESTEEEIGTNSGKITLNGTIYQPRGGILEICANCGTGSGGSGNLTSALQVISGALTLQGSINVNLTIPTRPFRRTVAALIE